MLLFTPSYESASDGKEKLQVWAWEELSRGESGKRLLMPQLPQSDLPALVISLLCCYCSCMWEASPEGTLGFALDSIGNSSWLPQWDFLSLLLLDVLRTQCDVLLSVCLSGRFRSQLS